MKTVTFELQDSAYADLEKYIKRAVGNDEKLKDITVNEYMSLVSKKYILKIRNVIEEELFKESCSIKQDDLD